MRKRSRIDWNTSHLIVTGGSSGIGEAVANEATTRGAKVSLIARDADRLEAVGSRIGAQWASADVTDFDAVQRAVEDLQSRSGTCTALVSCAGTSLPGRFLDVDVAEFGSQMALNYLGAVHVLRAVLPAMVASGNGSVLLTSSTAGLIGVVGYSGYGPTKAAVHQLAHSLRYEMEPHGITVGVLYPPDTQTPGFDVENARKPPETAAVSGAITPVEPSVVARAALNGMERGHHHIAADPLTKVLIRAGGLLEPAIRPFMNRTISRSAVRLY
ncbi:SDR family oxidoreductase [Rhodococcus sp. NPDC059969]|uniref:SDR family oxidoreductase n=1 Tax=Rhodococcus sp. NPDC059969 TaxID=3347018 RepID=UPI00366D471F